MAERVAIVGAGVSGLTCGVVLAERGFDTAIFAKEIGQQTTSGAAAAIWFPYDAQPAEKVIPWALETYKALIDLTRDPRSGVSMIDLRQFSRTGEIQIPDWAIPLGGSVIPSKVENGAAGEAATWTGRPEAERTGRERIKCREFTSGYAITVPLTDTTIYLDYLAARLLRAGGTINGEVCFEKLEEVDRDFDLVINCAGIGARELVRDTDLEPHRGQAIPRTNDCVFGGTNDLSSDLAADPATTNRIIAECSRVLNIERPNVLVARVGLRPFRKSGVRLEREKLRDGRIVIHNYGHGGSGFTLSWGCAREVRDIATL